MTQLEMHDQIFTARPVELDVGDATKRQVNSWLCAVQYAFSWKAVGRNFSDCLGDIILDTIDDGHG